MRFLDLWIAVLIFFTVVHYFRCVPHIQTSYSISHTPCSLQEESKLGSVRPCSVYLATHYQALCEGVLVCEGDLKFS